MGNELTPDILHEGQYDEQALATFREKYQSFETLDSYQEQLAELFEIKNPGNQSETDLQNFISERSTKLHGSWIAYSWSKKLVHSLNKDDYFSIRTNRNQFLIRADEQQELQQWTVAIAGLSVGNSIARALDASAVAGRLTLADRDKFSLSNLNRVNINLTDIDQPKLNVTAQQIYNLNPYANLELFPAGVSTENISDFFRADKLVVFDEIDDFEMKVRLRLSAKDKKVPLLMMTNLGDNVLIDIERYDQEDAQPFHGQAAQAIDSIMAGNLSEEDKKRYAAQLVGIENVPTRALESLGAMGKQLVGRPQLYNTVAISAGLAVFLTRQIILEPTTIKSGRHLFSIRQMMSLARDDLDMSETRQNILNLMRQAR
jgi:hypothetical protein